MTLMSTLWHAPTPAVVLQCVTSHSYPDANWTPPQYLYLNLDGIPVTNAAASSWCMNDYYSFQVLDRRTYYKDIERGLSASTCPGLGAYYQSMNMYQISFGPGSVNPLMQVSVPCSGGGSVSTASASIDNWDTHAHATVSAIEEPTWTGIENYINPSSAAVQRRSHTIPSLIPNSVLVRFPRARRSPAAAPMRRTWQASTLAAAAPSLAVTGVVAQDEPPLLESHTAAMQMEATNEVVRLDISADSGDVMSGAVALNPDDDGSGNGAEAATQEATAHAP